jgi:hypothetical protein
LKLVTVYLVLIYPQKLCYQPGKWV